MNDIFTVIILGLIAGIFFIWLVNRGHKRKQARLHQQIRDTAQAERDKQLQEAKDQGDFDNWKNNKSRLSAYGE